MSSSTPDTPSQDTGATPPEPPRTTHRPLATHLPPALAEAVDTDEHDLREILRRLDEERRG